MAIENPGRRKFFKQSGVTLIGAGFVLAMTWDDVHSSGSDLRQFKPNAWLTIGGDGEVVVYIVESEMGQGPITLMPMILAEELEVLWENIRVERAPLKPVYGYQQTGGSSSIRRGWATLRSAGAAAREMLIQAAAKTWDEHPDKCYANNGYVYQKNGDKKIAFGDLAETAASLPIPENVKLKSPEEFKILGTPIRRLDIPEKVNGQSQYGMDIKLPGMLYATTVHCPVFGGTLNTINAKDAESIPGVKKVFAIDNAVAIVAEDTWAAMKAAGVVEIAWNNGANTELSSENIREKLRLSVNKPDKTVYHRGDVSGVSSDFINHSASYDIPFQAHATMEPMNCTALVKDGKCEVWVPTQSPSAAREVAEAHGLSKFNFYKSKIARKFNLLDDDVVNVHTTMLGGGFGRRLQQDYVAEAVQIARQVKSPVQLVWSRQEDIQHDFYHPYTFHSMEGSLDASGRPVSWVHRISGIKGVRAAGLDYDIPNVKVEVASIDVPVPVGPWRSVFEHYYAFAKETFFDELIRKGNGDPLQMRFELLQDQRLKDVLELAAEHAQLKNIPDDHFIGFAVHKSFKSFVAEAVEISLKENQRIKIHRVIVAIDCGIVINPDIVKAQMEGSVVFALSAALKTSVSIKQGRVQESNFHDFPILQMDEMPVVETYIVESKAPPQGIGEPGVPPLAPALANAIFAATQKPIRSLPFNL